MENIGSSQIGEGDTRICVGIWGCWVCPNQIATYTDPKARWKQQGVVDVILVDGWMLVDGCPRRGLIEFFVSNNVEGSP